MCYLELQNSLMAVRNGYCFIIFRVISPFFETIRTKCNYHDPTFQERNNKNWISHNLNYFLNLPLPTPSKNLRLLKNNKYFQCREENFYLVLQIGIALTQILILILFTSYLNTSQIHLL